MNRPQPAIDTAIGKWALGVLLAIAFGLGGWNLYSTSSNAAEIGAMKSSRFTDADGARLWGDHIQDIGEVNEKLARIEGKLDRLIEMQDTP